MRRFTSEVLNKENNANFIILSWDYYCQDMKIGADLMAINL